MEKVPAEKLNQINQAALNETAANIETLVEAFMKESNLPASRVEIVQEVTPGGICIFVRERKQ